MNTKNNIIQRGAAIFIAASLFSSVYAADSGALSHSDKKFVENASKNGAKEIVISQDVLTKLSDPKIREYAQMVVTEHTAANAELTTLAAKKGVTIPSLSPKTDRKWSEKTKDIDEDYVKAMVNDHEEAVEAFEKAAKSNDPDIAAFAQKTLPSLQQHLAMAKDFKKTVK